MEHFRSIDNWFGTVLKNIGSLQNKGLELSLSADVLTGPFKWNTMLNWSTNKNKVLEIPGYIPTQQGTISGHLKVNGSWLEQDYQSVYGTC